MIEIALVLFGFVSKPTFDRCEPVLERSEKIFSFFFNQRKKNVIEYWYWSHFEFFFFANFFFLNERLRILFYIFKRLIFFFFFLLRPLISQTFLVLFWFQWIQSTVVENNPSIIDNLTDELIFFFSWLNLIEIISNRLYISNLINSYSRVSLSLLSPRSLSTHRYNIGYNHLNHTNT